MVEVWRSDGFKRKNSRNSMVTLGASKFKFAEDAAPCWQLNCTVYRRIRWTWRACVVALIWSRTIANPFVSCERLKRRAGKLLLLWALLGHPAVILCCFCCQAGDEFDFSFLAFSFASFSWCLCFSVWRHVAGWIPCWHFRGLFLSQQGAVPGHKASRFCNCLCNGICQLS